MTHLVQLLYKLKNDLQVRGQISRFDSPTKPFVSKLVGLASYRGSETGGHSHGTRTHQQVHTMGVILGLEVKDSGKSSRDKRDSQGGRGGS